MIAAAGAAQEPLADTFLPWEGGPACYARWRNGPPADPDFFPIAVWLQDPSRAAEYKAIGINLYVGLWRGPTVEQLKRLEAAGMPVLASYREGVQSDILRGYSLGDEPDNAQPRPGGGWGSCILPEAVIEQYKRLKEADDSRPVYLNLGQGVINESWKGRGEACSRRYDHYPEYIKGTDIVSYDVYPVNSRLPLWLTGAGVARLRKWAGYAKPVWNWIETTAIREEPKPSPEQIRAQVWMSIIQGGMGIGYFCHQFKPKEDDAKPLHDEETREALAAINRQVASLARVLNQRPVANGVTVESSNSDSPVEVMLKRLDGATYLFAAGARPGGETTARFILRGCGDVTAQVLGEDREIEVSGGVLTDRFSEYQVHLYRIPFDPNPR